MEVVVVVSDVSDSESEREKEEARWRCRKGGRGRAFNQRGSGPSVRERAITAWGAGDGASRARAGLCAGPTGGTAVCDCAAATLAAALASRGARQSLVA